MQGMNHPAGQFLFGILYRQKFGQPRHGFFNPVVIDAVTDTADISL